MRLTAYYDRGSVRSASSLAYSAVPKSEVSESIRIVRFLNSVMLSLGCRYVYYSSGFLLELALEDECSSLIEPSTDRPRRCIDLYNRHGQLKRHRVWRVGQISRSSPFEGFGLA